MSFLKTCPECNNKYRIKHIRVNRINSICRQCNGKKTWKLNNKKRKNQTNLEIKNTVRINISPAKLLELFESYSVTPAHKHKGRNILNARREMKALSTLDSAKIFLTVSNQKTIDSTKSFKFFLCKFLSQQNNSYKLEIGNIIYKKHTAKNIGYMPIKYEKWKNFLLAAKIYCHPRNKKRNAIQITKGSFFIDGRWLHIG